MLLGAYWAQGICLHLLPAGSWTATDRSHHCIRTVSPDISELCKYGPVPTVHALHPRPTRRYPCISADNARPSSDC
ncbi:hypothetical protein C8Q72DRAFT_830867 [Fomitopsis betulina]|nr:hypothetical protein C8Q72DRAFT_830867 [Fomitopsis betulina]